MATTVCATRSAIVGTPSRRTPEPCGLGISTALTGGGKYEPELIRFEILSRLSARSASNASRSCPSTPAAPLLALTRRHASQTIGLGIANGLSSVFGMFARFLPRPAPRLIDRTFRISRPLGSTATPASSDFTATTGRSASERRIGTQCLRFLPLAGSLSRPWRSTTPVAASTLAFSRSVQEPQTRLTPPSRRAPPGQSSGHPPGSSRENSQTPRFRCDLDYANDASKAHPHPVSRAGAFWNVFLVPT